MPYSYKNIPALLKQQSNWVVWGIKDAPLKAPFNPESLFAGKTSPAKAGVKETWGSYRSAVDCVNSGFAQGIGYEFDGNDLYGIDLDNVVDKYGAMTSEAYTIVDMLDSYTEISPSGTGLHIFVHAPGADIQRHRKKDFFLEIYKERRYFTVTGNIYGNVYTIETRTKEIQFIHDKFLMPAAPQNVAVVSPSLVITGFAQEKFLSIGLERDKVLASLWYGERRHGNESSDDIALMNKLAYWCCADPDAMVQAFLSSPYCAQKDEAHSKKCKRTDYLPKTALNACSTVYSTAAADHKRFAQIKSRERSCAR